MKISEYDIDNIRHALGAEPRYKKRMWGFRNHYCANTTGPDWDSMMRLEQKGYVVRGYKQEKSGTQFFHVTKAGGEAIGLKPYQIKNLSL